MDLNMRLTALMEFAYHILDIPELHSRFNEYLTVQADGEFESVSL